MTWSRLHQQDLLKYQKFNEQPKANAAINIQQPSPVWSLRPAAAQLTLLHVPGGRRRPLQLSTTPGTAERLPAINRCSKGASGIRQKPSEPPQTSCGSDQRWELFLAAVWSGSWEELSSVGTMDNRWLSVKDNYATKAIIDWGRRNQPPDTISCISGL